MPVFGHEGLDEGETPLPVARFFGKRLGEF
jgi:hypothetical protein